MMSNHKNNNNDENNLIPKSKKLKNYVKKGTQKEIAINELYNVTTKKLGNDYRNKLSQLLYDGNQVKHYFSKRVNLDEVIYENEDDKKLYITLTKFKNQKNVNSFKNIGHNKNNNSFQNYTENMSKFLTCDTNNYNNNENIIGEKKKLKVKDLYDKFKEERMNIEIKKLLLNEEKDLPKHLEREIFEQLSQKYNFIKDKDNNSRPKNISSIYGSKSLIKSSNSFFPQYNKNFESIKLIKEKTEQLNSLKSKKYTNYLSPIFFLGKTRDKYLHNISYASHKKFRKQKKEQNINDIKKENIKYLKLIGNEINELHEINKDNKKIITES